MSEIVKIKLADVIEDGDGWNRPLEEAEGAEMDVLVASLANMGQLTPIVVRPASKEKWRVVMGHRRVRAARKLHWKEIEARVTEMDDEGAQGAAFAENYARKQVSIYWEAEEVRRWLARGDSQAQVAARLGRSAGWVKRRARLDLEACRRFKKEVLDPRGISMDEVHPTNLELLAECGPNVWEAFGKIDSETDRLRRNLGRNDWLAGGFLREKFRRVWGQSWNAACEDPDTGRSFPDCEQCEHLAGALTSLFPEMDPYYFGWDPRACAQKECIAAKHETWRKLAEAEAKEKHPELAVVTGKKLSRGDWVKCKPTHKNACIAVYDGDRSGVWEVVRPLKKVTGKAETGTAEQGEGQTESEEDYKKWKEEQDRLWKRTEANRVAVETLLEQVKTRLDEGREGRDPNMQVVHDALIGYADLLKLNLVYEEPEEDEFAEMVNGLARAVLTAGESADAAETVAEWLSLHKTEET